MTEIKDFPAECLIVSAGVFLSGRAGPDKYLLGPSYDLLDLVSLMTHRTYYCIYRNNEIHRDAISEEKLSHDLL